MTWNHRVIRHDDKPGDKLYVWFGVHECIYDNARDEIPTSWTADAIPVLGANPAELVITVERIKDAMKKPILEIDGNKLKIWKEKP